MSSYPSSSQPSARWLTLLCVAYAALTSADFVTTAWGLGVGIVEQMPVARFLLAVGGLPLFGAEHLGAVLLVVLAVPRTWRRYAKPADVSVRLALLLGLAACCGVLVVYVVRNLVLLWPYLGLR